MADTAELHEFREDRIMTPLLERPLALYPVLRQMARGLMFLHGGIPGVMGVPAEPHPINRALSRAGKMHDLEKHKAHDDKVAAFTKLQENKAALHMQRRFRARHGLAPPVPPRDRAPSLQPMVDPRLADQVRAQAA